MGVLCHSLISHLFLLKHFYKVKLSVCTFPLSRESLVLLQYLVRFCTQMIFSWIFTQIGGGHYIFNVESQLLGFIKNVWPAQFNLQEIKKAAAEAVNSLQVWKRLKETEPKSHCQLYLFGAIREASAY